jgi:hypothetical protein
MFHSPAFTPMLRHWGNFSDSGLKAKAKGCHSASLDVDLRKQ